MQDTCNVSIDEAKQLLKKETSKFVAVIADGKMTVEYYVPKLIDGQSPHKKDELYIIASGTSGLIGNKEMITCAKGNVIFVAAHVEHRFLNFSNDFATWVIFYGDEKL